MIDELHSSPFRGFVRPALFLAGCVGAVALLLSPIAIGRTGSGGPAGLAIAAAFCLVAGWIAEALAYRLHRSVSPLGVMLLGMAIRMVPPLGVCLMLAAQGARGREHLAFIGYLLAFYLVTLALETWLTVKRVGRTSSNINLNAR